MLVIFVNRKTGKAIYGTDKRNGRRQRLCNPQGELWAVPMLFCYNQCLKTEMWCRGINLKHYKMVPVELVPAGGWKGVLTMDERKTMYNNTLRLEIAAMDIIEGAKDYFEKHPARSGDKSPRERVEHWVQEHLTPAIECAIEDIFGEEG